MQISFKKVTSSDGVLDVRYIYYTDENGVAWLVPQDHRFWTEIYEPWLAAGNTPLPPL